MAGSLQDKALTRWIIGPRGELVWQVNHLKAKIGDHAGSIDSKGYRVVRLDGKRYRQHHVVWLMTRGYLPKELDHIDNDRSNNAPRNLQEVSHQTNMNKVRGKAYRKLGNKFWVQININKERISKSFLSEDDAIHFVKEIYNRR